MKIISNNEHIINIKYVIGVVVTYQPPKLKTKARFLNPVHIKPDINLSGFCFD